MKKQKTKAKMIDDVRIELGISRSEAGRIYDCFSRIIRQAVESGESVSLFGIGTLHVVKRASYVGVNPNNGEPWTLPDTYHAKFNTSSSIKQALNAKKD